MRAFITGSLVLLAALSSVLAAPYRPRVPRPQIPRPINPVIPKLERCDISSAQMPVPAGQTDVQVTPPQKHKYVGLGLGVQNYTCSAAGTWAAAGAVAKLFDISCFIDKPFFNTLANKAVDSLLKRVPAEQIVSSLVGRTPFLLGDHFFVTNPVGSTPAILPVFDFTKALKDSSKFILANKTGATPAPTGAQDVPFLKLANVQGSLASTVFRVNTKAGQPPASCSPGAAPLSVPYAAHYWFDA